LSGGLNLSCNNSSEKSCGSTLSGYGSFMVTDGKMPKLGSLEYLLRAGNLFKGGLLNLSVNGMMDLVSPLKTGSFDTIRGNFAISNGVAKEVQIFSKGKDLSLFLTGAYDLVNQNADMMVLGRLSRKVSTMLGPLGNFSLNTLFNIIPRISSADMQNSFIISEINKIPGIEISNNEFRFFAVEIKGDINGDDYVQSFRWVEE